MKVTYLNTCEIRATLEVVTGLHIGSGRDAVEIGGVDSPVIKHPHNQRPFIPGSSLKGKLRSLLEWALGKIDPNGNAWGGEAQRPMEDLRQDEILRIFGTTKEGWNVGPTRIIVRDAHLTQEWVDRLEAARFPLTEDKTEVSINRIEGKAKQGGLRTIERVPAGATFGIEILFRRYDVDDQGARDLQCLNRVLEALKLLEKDCLGGSGSRGYGQVRITGLTVDGVALQSRFDAMAPIQRAQPQMLVQG